MSETATTVEQGDAVQSTLLYRNTKAVQQQMEAQTSLIQTMQIETKRLRNEVTVLTTETVALRHMVDTMWVKWMGHGSTEEPDGDND